MSAAAAPLPKAQTQPEKEYFNWGVASFSAEAGPGDLWCWEFG